MLALEAAQLDGPHFSCLYPDGVFYDLDSCKHSSYPDSEGAPDPGSPGICPVPQPCAIRGGRLTVGQPCPGGLGQRVG
ncbi:Spi-B transcription factor [Homo sapiens]|uniref:Spi-B transcription factor n=1 Tax=Homo sapiens TaxID=9606 RepID=M0R037_HUMAN|nr:Spi-B transcription factor [Homo sapiens]KAI4044174.1 Spi-B transcription factor [Homo sapiens]